MSSFGRPGGGVDGQNARPVVHVGHDGLAGPDAHPSPDLHPSLDLHPDPDGLAGPEVHSGPDVRSGPEMRSGPDVGSGPDVIASGPAARARGRRNRTTVIAALLLAALLLVFLSYRWGSASVPRAASTAAPSSAPSSAPPTTPQIYSAVAPSVVSIQAAHGGSAGDTGTGVIVNADGTIMTALHVVKGATAIQVTFADGTISAATVTATDPAIDIATLGPATLPSVLVPAVLGRSDQLAVGDSVIAIGNQLGLTRTTTTGVVSGLNREATNTDGTNLTGLIQFDAAVNPGSSGGPLLNGRGQTVGIVVALANPTSAGTFIGVGFAVPITAAAGGGGRAPQQ